MRSCLYSFARQTLLTVMWTCGRERGGQGLYRRGFGLRVNWSRINNSDHWSEGNTHTICTTQVTWHTGDPCLGNICTYVHMHNTMNTHNTHICTYVLGFLYRLLFEQIGKHICTEWVREHRLVYVTISSVSTERAVCVFSGWVSVGMTVAPQLGSLKTHTAHVCQHGHLHTSSQCGCGKLC